MTKMLSLFATSALAATATAQTSELFLTDFMDTHTYVVQNGQIVRQFSRTAWNDGPALVVQSTIRMYGQVWGGVGHEYDLNGNLLAGQYTNPFYIDCLDGATDGTRNWTIPANDASMDYAVLKATASWENIAVAFVPQRRSFGITYDYTDDTLWLTNKSTAVCDRVQHYDTNGTLLGEFPVSIDGGGGGIALDQADQTLWIPGAFATVGNLYQFDKAGNLLQTVTVPGLNTNTFGAEFYSVTPFDNYCKSNNNSTGGKAIISAKGDVRISVNDLTLTAAPVPNQVFLFIHGNSPNETPFGNGYLCIAGGITRVLPPAVATGNMAQRTVDISGFTPGTKYFQCWFRDPMGGGAAFDTSNGISITFVP
jgi:hypothetical protein